MKLNGFLNDKETGFMPIQDLYQELIVEHGTCPRNCCALPNASCDAEGFNPLCGDKVKVYLKVENNKIQRATFEGKGCAISMASASLMTESLVGKTLEEVMNLFEAFKHLMNGTSNDNPLLGKLLALSGVNAFPVRVKCATLAWHTLLAALKKETQIISTESLEDATL